MMENPLNALIATEDKKDFKEFISFLAGSRMQIISGNDIIQLFRNYCDKYDKSESFRNKSSIFSLGKKTQELFVVDDHLALMHRHAMAKYRFYLVRKDGEYIEEISLLDYLDFKDSCVLQTTPDSLPLRLDFKPFYHFTPTIRDIRSVGNGIRFLNRYMSSSIFSRPKKWVNDLFNFIKTHRYNGHQLLVNGTISKDPEDFLSELEKMLDWLENKPSETPYSSIQLHMKEAGFQVGWGPDSRNHADPAVASERAHGRTAGEVYFPSSDAAHIQGGHYLATWLVRADQRTG